MVANTTDPTILDDHPALQRKLAAFLCDYGLTARPIVVWQAGPTIPQKLDPSDAKIAAVLRAGVPAADAWSRGFNSHEQPSVIFEGLASFRDPKDTGWITEVHSDGHVIAGLWNFPEKARDGKATPHLLPWHSQVFEQFGQLTAKLHAAAGIDAPMVLTATMLNATGFVLALEENRMPMQLRPISRPTLQWSVEAAASRAEIEGAASRLADQYRRLFELTKT